MKRYIFISLSLLFIYINVFGENSKGWVIKTKNFERYNGITLANGCIGLVSGKELFSVSDIVINNVFDRNIDSKISCIANTPFFMSLKMKINGEEIDDTNTTGKEQTFNMQKAYLKTTAKNTKADIKYILMALGNLPYMAMGVVEVYPKEDITLQVYNNIEDKTNNNTFKTKFKRMNDLESIFPIITSNTFTNVTNKQISTCSAFLFDNNKDIKDVKGVGNSIYFKKELKKGNKYRFALIGSVCNSRYFTDPYNASERFVVSALCKNIDQLLKGHYRYWKNLWKSDIIIEGNEEDQKDVRLALYNLYSSQRINSRLSISPMGLSSSKGYNGHIFWDSEIWMFPPILLLNPKLAKSHIDYRYDRLNKAIKQASDFGYKGAMYPWESDDSGEESTPSWCLTGPFEQHISGDISIAFWNYYCVTKDKNWLRNKGYKVIKNVANFWLSRVTKNNDGSFSINNIVGADEYAHNINDNAYTNAVAKTALLNAVKVAKILETKPNPKWISVAKGLKIHYMTNGIIKEHSNYNGEKIKQADVNLLSFPLNMVKDKNDIERNLIYYRNKIDSVNGPAMTNSIFSILYSKIGNRNKAYEMFKKSYEPNKRPPFGVLSESPSSDNPYFMTGAGGLLQAVLFGFANINISDKGIVKGKASLPKEWKSLTIKGLYGEKTDYKIVNK